MKQVIVLTFLMFVTVGLKAQTQYASQYMELDSTFVSIKMFDNKEKIGHLVEQNEDYLVIWTEVLGRVQIPKYLVDRIEEVDEVTYVAVEDRIPHYSGRYHLLFNGLPQRKGSSTLGLTIASADYQYSLDENTTLGIIGSWLGLGAMASFKHSEQIAKNLYGTLGIYAGGFWVSEGFVLPYISMTYGNERANVTFGGGLSYIGYETSASKWSPSLFAAATIPLGERVQWVSEGAWAMPQTIESRYYDDYSIYGLGYIISAFRFPLKNNAQVQAGMQIGYDEYQGKVYAVGALPLLSYSKSW